MRRFAGGIFEIKGETRKYDIVVSTISPEIFNNYKYGKLRWMGRDFMKMVLPVKSVFPNNIFSNTMQTKKVSLAS